MDQQSAQVAPSPNPYQLEMLCGNHYKNPDWTIWMETLDKPDITLTIHRDRIQVHSQIVSIRSIFFDQNINGFMERQSYFDLNRLPITPKGLHMAIEFMYEGQVTVSADCLFHVILASITLQITQLQHLLDAYLLSIAQHDQIALWCLDLAYGMPIDTEIRHRLTESCAVRLQSLIKDKDFGKLHFEPLCALLQNDKVVDGKQILEIFDAWLRANPEEQENREMLIKRIRPDLVNYKTKEDHRMNCGENEMKMKWNKERKSAGQSRVDQYKRVNLRGPLSGLHLLVDPMGRIKLVS